MKFLKETICIFIFHILVTLALHSQDKHLRLIEKFLDTRNSFSYMSYDVQMKWKMFSMEDTILTKASVELLRDETDTIFAGQVLLDLDSFWLGYNGEQIFNANLTSSTLILADPVEFEGVYIKSTFYNKLIDDGFMKKSKNVLAIIQDTTIKVEMKDTFINGSPCLAITMRVPDEDEFYNMTYTVTIDTVNLFVVRRSYSVYFQENEQYDEWNFSNVRFRNDNQIAKFESDTFDQFDKIQNYERYNPEQEAEATYDYTALSGKLLNEERILSLDEVDAPFILLDFWYMSCYPCIKGIPAVNELTKKYPAKDVAIFGVNMLDNEVKDKSRFEKFARNNPMLYPTIMISPDNRKLISINGYPTFLILDQERKVVFEHVGYSEDLLNEVTAFLDSRF